VFVEFAAGGPPKNLLFCLSECDALRGDDGGNQQQNCGGVENDSRFQGKPPMHTLRSVWDLKQERSISSGSRLIRPVSAHSGGAVNTTCGASESRNLGI
jgi:hypothetical protein